jgi:hypothetical protein
VANTARVPSNPGDFVGIGVDAAVVAAVTGSVGIVVDEIVIFVTGAGVVVTGRGVAVTIVVGSVVVTTVVACVVGFVT